MVVNVQHLIFATFYTVTNAHEIQRSKTEMGPTENEEVEENGKEAMKKRYASMQCKTTDISIETDTYRRF